MNIVYSSDDNYARHCAASMVSIMENNREEEKLDFWMLNVGLSGDNLEKLASVCRKYDRTLHVVDFSDIRSYSELEVNIRMIKREVEASQISRQFHRFKANEGPQWSEWAMLVFRFFKKRFHKEEEDD